jgi:hypothetical protein
MKRLPVIFALIVLALGVTASPSALAFHHGGHVRFGVFIGPGFYYPSPYYGYPPYYPPYYYPPVAPVPQTYVEQGVAQPAPALSQGSWYYCDASRAYYPYVKECPAGWQRVAPQPAN